MYVAVTSPYPWDRGVTESLQKVVLEETTIWTTYEGRKMMSEHLNFFNKIISELQTVDVKIDEEDKTLILLSSLSESYYHIINIMLTVRKLSSWRSSCQLSYLLR